jgi:ferredoxin-nitrite reductase
VLPVGKMTVAQMRALATIAGDCGDGDVRLTVWQNLLISGIPSAKLDEAKSRVEAAGLDWRASNVRAGLVACTGNTGCKFAASDTKLHAAAIADWCDARLTLDVPINIHLTGCHHSCAQHYVGDIGLLGTKVAESEDADPVEGYNVVVGGGFAADAKIGRELFSNVKAPDVPMTVESILKTYIAKRISPAESFQAFAARHDIEALKSLISGAGG